MALARKSELRSYRIVVLGEFGKLLSSAFSDLEIKTGGGTTELTTHLGDASELYEVLEHLRDFAIELVSVHEVTSPTKERV